MPNRHERSIWSVTRKIVGHRLKLVWWSIIRSSYLLDTTRWACFPRIWLCQIASLQDRPTDIVWWSGWKVSLPAATRWKWAILFQYILMTRENKMQGEAACVNLTSHHRPESAAQPHEWQLILPEPEIYYLRIIIFSYRLPSLIHL